MLTVEQKKFESLLQKTSFLVVYWDFNIKECDVKRLKNAIGYFSHGERIMANFYMALWLGDIDVKFDIFEAASTLNQKQLAVINEWLTDPFWP